MTGSSINLGPCQYQTGVSVDEEKSCEYGGGADALRCIIDWMRSKDRGYLARGFTDGFYIQQRRRRMVDRSEAGTGRDILGGTSRF